MNKVRKIDNVKHRILNFEEREPEVNKMCRHQSYIYLISGIHDIRHNS